MLHDYITTANGTLTLVVLTQFLSLSSSACFLNAGEFCCVLLISSSKELQNVSKIILECKLTILSQHKWIQKRGFWLRYSFILIWQLYTRYTLKHGWWQMNNCNFAKPCLPSCCLLSCRIMASLWSSFGLHTYTLYIHIVSQQ